MDIMAIFVMVNVLILMFFIGFPDAEKFPGFLL